MFVLLPLIAATMILFCLQFLWLSAGRISEEERRQSEVVGLLHRVCANWSLIDSACIGLSSEHGSKSHPDINGGQDMLGQALVELNQKRQNEPEKHAVLEKISDLIQRECTLMSSLSTRAASQDTSSLTPLRELPQILLSSYQMRGEVRQMLEAEWLALRSDRESAQKNQKALRALIYGGIILNIAGGIIIVSTFALRVRKRVSRLNVNSKILHQGQKLHDCLKGNDELAYIDMTLHDVERRLLDAAQHHQWMLAMLANDMCSQLISALANLRNLEELDDHYSEQGRDELRSVSGLLEYVLHRLEKLPNAQEKLSAIEPASQPTKTTPRPLYGADWKTILLTPGILRQSIVLIFCPLLFQFFLFLVIDQHLLATDRTMAEQKRCSEVALYSDMIQMDMLRGALVQAAYVMSRAPMASDRAWAAFDQVNRDYANLATLCESNPDWLKIIALSRDAAKHKIDRILTSSATNIHDGALLFLDVGEGQQKASDAVQIGTIESRLFAENIARWTAEDAVRSRLAKSIEFAIAVNLASNLLFSTLLVLFITKLTKNRLDALMRNTTALRQHKQLEPCIKGTDEIASLDFAIHEAETLLGASSKELALLASALTTDIKEPLEQAARHIRKFKSLGKASLSAKSLDCVNLCEESIARTVVLIKELLAKDITFSQSG